MLYTIDVPSRDYKAIEQWIKRGRVLMPEIIGRVYETSGDGFTITAEIMADNQAVLYMLHCNEEKYSKIIKAPICYFTEYGVTVAFDIDKSYD